MFTSTEVSPPPLYCCRCISNRHLASSALTLLKRQKTTQENDLKSEISTSGSKSGSQFVRQPKKIGSSSGRLRPNDASFWRMVVIFGVLLALLSRECDAISTDLKLTSSDDTYVHGIEGFGTNLHCRVNTCIGKDDVIQWYKDDILIAEGQTSYLQQYSKAHIEHNVNFNDTKDCSGACSDVSADSCPAGQQCLENSCCFCNSEEFNLFVKNLTVTDGGRYRCQIKNQPDSVIDLELDVVESGLPEDFHKNMTYNYTACCKKHDIKPECQPLCNIGSADVHQLDLVACESELPKFLHCVTDGGNISHIQCCRLSLVPPFCWDFCMGSKADFKGTHRLCTYWLSEVLECYERSYLPFSGPPENLFVNSKGPDTLQACWKPPALRGESISYYTVHYRELPRFPFFSGSPFLPDDGPMPPGTGPEDIDKEVQTLEREDDILAPPVASPPPASVSLRSRRPGVSGGLPTWTRRRDRDDNDNSDEEGYGETRRREPREARLASYDNVALEGDDDVDTLVHKAMWDPSGIHYRRKRQSFIFITHNTATNETFTKPFPSHAVNTSDLCATLDGLSPSTQYFVYVTATNSYGTSLPSVRALAITVAEVIPNGTLPDIAGCCRQHNVSPSCAPKICNLGEPPTPLGALDITLNCRTEFVGVSPCLADNRNHTKCCRDKGVSGECLKLCSGTPAALGLSAVLCLNMDMYSVYSCLRQGYAQHPSPPQNVTVFDVQSNSAQVKWEPPDVHPDKVMRYALFFREDSSSNFIEIDNVTSPHQLLGLLPSTSYMVYLISHGANGSSLQSTMDDFITLPKVATACRYGQPFLDPDNNIVPCNDLGVCPSGFDCLTGRSEADSMCCPSAPDVGFDESQPQPYPNITACCVAKDADPSCVHLCSYNTTKSDLLESSQCLKDIKTWVDCGADGRDHRPCCISSGVPESCLDFCFPPLKRVHRGHLICMSFADQIIECGRRGILKLPGPPVDFHLVGSVNEGTASFAWSRPYQNTSVHYYLVYVTDTATGAVQKTNTTALSVTVHDLLETHEYEATAISYNQHGNSAPSTNLTFIVEKVVDKPDRDLIPEQPYALEVAWSRNNRVNLTWQWSDLSLSQKHLANVTFVLNYGEHIFGGHPQYDSKVYRKDKWGIAYVRQNKNYQAYVVAVNSVGGKNYTSMQSEIIDVFEGIRGISSQELEQESGLRLYVTPQKDIYKEGDKVSISCVANFPDSSFNPVLTLTVQNEDLKHSGNVTYDIDDMKRDLNKRPILCSAETLRGRVTTKLNLKVSYVPIVFAKKRGAFKLVEGTGVRIECEVRSFPTPTVSWFWTNSLKRDESSPVRNITGSSYDSAKFSTLTDSHFSTLIETTWEEEKFESSLTIDSVLDEDAGYYWCNACNVLGCNVSFTHLHVDPFPIPEPPSSVQDCCKAQGVRPECQSACSFDIDISTYENDTSCLQEFPKLMKCAKDGHDYTMCCTKRGVITECLSYCDGSDHSAALSPRLNPLCADYNAYIILCLEEKHNIAPSAPLNVVAKQLYKDSLNVSWEKPLRNPTSVEIYVVFYRPAEVRDADWTMVKKKNNQRWVVLDGINLAELYSLTVAAGNHHGYFAFAPEQRIQPSSADYRTSDGTGHSGSSSTHSSAAAIGVLFLVLLVIVFGLVAMYVRRKPELLRRLPVFFGPRIRGIPNGAVAFENPGYDKEGQIHGLPGEGNQGNAHSRNGDTGWQSPNLSPPDDVSGGEPAQKNMKYTQLSSSS